RSGMQYVELAACLNRFHCGDPGDVEFRWWKCRQYRINLIQFQVDDNVDVVSEPRLPIHAARQRPRQQIWNLLRLQERDGHLEQLSLLHDSFSWQPRQPPPHHPSRDDTSECGLPGETSSCDCIRRRSPGARPETSTAASAASLHPFAPRGIRARLTFL